ncbi:MAG: MFS transporter [Deltaproteobacteria bacterium]|nr:MFS transporter [Deltaproteobacteria bacterium]
MLNRIKALPLRVRHTFYYDIKAAALFGIFGGCVLPFIAIIGRKIGATELQISLLTAAPYIATAFAVFWTADILGKGRVWYVVWPNVVGRGVFFAMFFITTPFPYTLLIFVFMVITAIPFPSYASVMKTNYPDKERGGLMGYVRVGSASFWILSSIAAGLILEKSTYNYRYIFPAAAVFGILSALEFGRIKVRLEKRQKERLATISHLTAPLKNRGFLKFIIIYSIFEFGFLLWLPLYPLILVDKVHISNITAGVFGALYSGMWLAGFFFWGRFLDRHSLSNCLKLFFAVASFIPLIYLLTYNIWFLAIAQCIAGITFAAIELIGYIVITRMSHHKETPRYMAVHVVFGGVRGATAPFLGPVIMNYFGAGTATAISLSFILTAFFTTSLLKKGN